MSTATIAPMNLSSLVVPELQRRSLFRTEYTGKTLRENLGLGKASLTPAVRSPALTF